jgi:TrmH family RNA methyltransferase
VQAPSPAVENAEPRPGLSSTQQAMMHTMTGPDDNRLRRIGSRQNASVKELRKAFTQGEVTDHGFLAIEGVRIIEEAIRSGLRFHTIFFSEKGAAHSERLLPQISQQTEALLLPDGVFLSAVTTDTPQGVAALVKLKPARLEELIDPEGDPLMVGVAGIQDPGNLGTIIRSAEAFGARAVLLGENTVSSANPKTVRASAGSLFREPLVNVKMSEALPLLKQKQYRVIASSSHKGRPVYEVDLTGPVVLLVGNEGAGLPSAILSQADEFVTIPHSARVESLNAGIAASILLYEAARQRKAHH